MVKDILGADSPLTTGGPVREQVGGLLRGILADRPPRATIFFLFRGQGPLSLTLQAREPFPLQVVPRHNAALHRLWLDAWWREYSAAPPLCSRKKADYPPLLENYLATTLARRLNLRLPEEKQTESAYARLEHEAGVMLETESILLGLEQNRILGMTNFALPADQPLPEPVDPPPLEVPEPDAKVTIEPIAMHVPAECFYVRFGSFSNFLWMQDTMDTWGGDLQNLVAQRGLDYGRDERMQDQLILRQTELSRLLGDTVISDVAIVGSDMFFREGAAYGFLFEARNNLLLGSDLSSERSDRLARGGVTEQKLTLAGREVSLIASPDGSVRSYYAQSGDYHFITSSRALAERFLQVARGPGSLGASKEFRHARTVMPLQRNDTVFVYLSDAFFRNITGPRYRVETMRRLEAVADIELVQLARLASRAEGRQDGSIEQLIAGGLLPASFGPRPDGSRAVLSRGEVQDQLRGRRGTMTPVPDVPSGASPRPRPPPTPSSPSITVPSGAGSIPHDRPETPIAAGQARPDRARRPHDAVGPAAFRLFRQMVWRGREGASGGGARRHGRAGIDPARPAAFRRPAQRRRAAATSWPAGAIWERLRNVLIGYVGSYGPPGPLALLDLTIPGPPDAAGYSSNALGLWRRQFDHFSVYSFQPEILATVTPQFHFEDAPRPGQVRLHVGDLAQARVTPALNRWGYARTRETSLGNLRLLHALQQQIARPGGRLPQSGRVAFGGATDLPAGRQVCVAPRRPTDKAAGPRRPWNPGPPAPRSAPASIVIPQSGGMRAAPAYVAPPLNWFRGLDMDATMIEGLLSAHAEILMQQPVKK